MKILSKTILISLIALFGAGVLFIQPTLAGPSLTVEFEQNPLFSNTDIKPGDSVTKWIKVTNHYYDQTKPIAVEAIYYPGFPDSNNVPTDDLSRALDIVISQGATVLYNKTLYDFYVDGETYLSDIGPEQTIQYDFTISFPSEKENEWQNKTTGFDILIGFQGEEGGNGGNGGNGGDGNGGGGGGYSPPPGLTILDESVHATTTGTCEVIITWTTSYNSTSQVIYAQEGEAHYLNPMTPPNYGYARKTPEYDTDPKVKEHSVTISGLTPLTTYYYRAVSHASPATISTQYTFTTTSCSELYEEEVPGGEEPPAETPPAEPGEEIVIGPGPGEEIPPAEEEGEAIAQVPSEEEEEEEVEEPEESALANFLASLSDIFGGCFPWWLILILALYPLMKLINIQKEKKKEFPLTTKHVLKNHERVWLILTLFLVFLALYFYYIHYFCIAVWILLVLGLATFLIRYFILKQGKANQAQDQINLGL